MRIKQGLILLLIVCIVVAEVSAGKQKRESGKEGKKEKGKNHKHEHKHGHGKHKEEGHQSHHEENGHEEHIEEGHHSHDEAHAEHGEKHGKHSEEGHHSHHEEKAKNEGKKGSKKAGKEEKMKHEEQKSKKNEKEGNACECAPGPAGPPGPPGPPGECIYQPVCPETISKPESCVSNPDSCGAKAGHASAEGSCMKQEETCTNDNLTKGGADCPCKNGADCPCKTGAECPCKNGADCPCKTGAECPCKNGGECPCKSGGECPCKGGKSECPFKGKGREIFLAKGSGVLAIHSQNTIVPECPPNQNKLWEGYSLMKIDTNGESSSFELGTPGSCMKNFMPTIAATCDIEGKCTTAQRNDRSYWLLANGTVGSDPITQEMAQNLVSRCVVCDMPSAVVAVHSQSIEIPKCPAGWSDLWTGYSYLNSKQNLARPGSCLKEFKNPLFIECNPGKGSCNLLETHKTSWLVAEKTPEDKNIVQETVEKVESLVKETPAPSVDISRCVVCIKAVEAAA